MAEHSESARKAPNLQPSAIVPELAASRITQAELKTTVEVLQAVALLNSGRKRKLAAENSLTEESASQEDEGLQAFKSSNLRPFRKALAGCIELQTRAMFKGKTEEEHYEERKALRSLKRQKVAESAQNRKYIESTALRKGRIEKLQKLREEAKAEEQAKLMAFLVPDGHVDSAQVPAKLLTDSRSEETAVASAENQPSSSEPAATLPRLRSCYVCKIRYREMHHFYDQLCLNRCAPLNWEKRHQTADLSGRVAVVTGARVKIGFQVCLKLLRAGCEVVATTRFPNAAAGSYRQEKDFDQWKHRLHVFGLDLRDVTGIEAFTRFLKMKYEKTGVDILINNACQTVRRPRGYYLPMMEREQSLWESNADNNDFKDVLRGCAAFEIVRRRLVVGGGGSGNLIGDGGGGNARNSGSATLRSPSPASASSSTMVVSVEDRSSSADVRAPYQTTGISHSAAMSQMIILPEDAGVPSEVLPPGVSDINGQQLDLRQTNSWLLKMDEVSTPEVMECMFVNAIAPFVLNSRLKPLMTAPADDPQRPDRFIVNVSAMEGKFYRYKMPNHPHTNMAKAALNMMTRTCADDLATKHRIYMNSVDTGWINDENPLDKASKIAKTNHFQTPIDEIDAAARILDPVFVGVNGGRASEKDFGKFLKDYHETEW